MSRMNRFSRAENRVKILYIDEQASAWGKNKRNGYLVRVGYENKQPTPIKCVPLVIIITYWNQLGFRRFQSDIVIDCAFWIAIRIFQTKWSTKTARTIKIGAIFLFQNLVWKRIISAVTRRICRWTYWPNIGFPLVTTIFSGMASVGLKIQFGNFCKFRSSHTVSVDLDSLPMDVARKPKFFSVSSRAWILIFTNTQRPYWRVSSTT